MKKLLRILNTTINTSVLEYFDNVYISDGVKTAFSTDGLQIWWIASVKQLRDVIRALQTSMFIFLTKIVSNVSLKTLTILVKKLIVNN